MPVFSRKPPHFHPAHDELVGELVRHLQPAEGDVLPELPRIIEESVRLSPALRVFVIWDRWHGVAERERDEIILEAYDQARGRPEMARIAVVRGLTPQEALELGATHLLKD